MKNLSQQPPLDSIDESEIESQKPLFPDIIDMIRRTCAKLMTEEIVKINDTVSKRSPRPFIVLKSGKLQGKWLYDTGAAVTCMSLKAFRSIPIENRPKKLGSDTKAQGATGSSLIPTGIYLFSTEWNGKKNSASSYSVPTFKYTHDYWN